MLGRFPFWVRSRWLMGKNRDFFRNFTFPKQLFRKMASISWLIRLYFRAQVQLIWFFKTGLRTTISHHTIETQNLNSASVSERNFFISFRYFINFWVVHFFKLNIISSFKTLAISSILQKSRGTPEDLSRHTSAPRHTGWETLFYCIAEAPIYK